MTSSFKQPDYGTQGGTAYPAAIDAAIAVLARIGASFAAHAQAAPDMTVRVDAGWIPRDGNTPLEVAAADTGTLTAPAGNPRHDIVHIDRQTGAVAVATGAEAASPADPAVPTGKMAVARVRLSVGMTEIADPDIDDLRGPGLLGLGTAATVPIKPGGTEAAATDADNEFSGPQTIVSADGGAAEGPTWYFARNSPSPAGGDVLGAVALIGQNSAAEAVRYGGVFAKILDPTDGSEDGQLLVQAVVGGTVTTIAAFGAGVQVGAPTGGDKGIGAINAQSLWLQGVQIDQGSPSDGQALAYSSGLAKYVPTTISTTPPAGSVGQTELDTSEALQTTSSTAWTHLTLTGGEYGFWPRYSGGGGGNQVFAAPAEGHNIANYVSRTAIQSSAGNTVGVTQRYVNASPPFDLGDGEAAGFIFAFVDAAANVVGLSIADAPPWAYNGPTSLRPHKIEGGKKYRRVLRDSDLGRFLGGEIGLDAWRAARGGAEAGWAAARADAARALADSIDAEAALAAEIAEAQAGLQRAAARALRESWAAQLALKEAAARDARTARLAAEDAAKIDPAFDWVEIEQAMKQFDMGLLPHDRTGNDLTGLTAVLIDPMDPTVKYLIDAQSAGEDVAALFHGGRLKIDNTPLTRAGPPGVLVCAIKD